MRVYNVINNEEKYLGSIVISDDRIPEDDILGAYDDYFSKAYEIGANSDHDDLLDLIEMMNQHKIPAFEIVINIRGELVV